MSITNRNKPLLFRVDFNTILAHRKDELTQQENVILLKLFKNKEVLAKNGGGKREKMNRVVTLF